MLKLGVNKMYGLRQEIIEKIKNIATRNSVKIIIFGSRARGNYKPTSDIDLAVIENITEEQKYKIIDEIDQIDSEYKIDLVFAQNIKNNKFFNEIKKEGIVL